MTGIIIALCTVSIVLALKVVSLELNRIRIAIENLK